MLVLSVSQLNQQVKNYLEQRIGLVYVEGEISNLSKPGHIYFTLKDSGAQIRCAFFKNRHFSSMTPTLNNGQQVVVSGILSLYEARGEYQLIVEHLTESGLGALYQQFEALKNKLAAEGLFLQSRKRPLPVLPRTIGVITSMNGAALQDILATLLKRFPLAKILVYCSEVQGATAALQLVNALQAAQRDLRCDVLILARGGGSIEDLWAFNDEQLARQIACCTIPIVSGIGHETDFTIADFVADYRAETPTAAATAVTPNYIELFNHLTVSISRLQIAMKKIMHHCLIQLEHLKHKTASPQQAIATYWQKLNYLEQRLITCFTTSIKQKKYQLQLELTQLHANNPKIHLKQQQTQLNQMRTQLHRSLQVKINDLRFALNNQLNTLNAVSPLATLDRGYAIAIKETKIVSNAEQVRVGDQIEVRLAKGHLSCKVIQKYDTPSGFQDYDN